MTYIKRILNIIGVETKGYMNRGKKKQNKAYIKIKQLKKQIDWNWYSEYNKKQTHRKIDSVCLLQSPIEYSVD